MTIAAFDHVAIPIADVEAMLAFYARLGFRVDRDRAPRYAVHFGDNKINMHAPAVWQDRAFTLRGPSALPGCGDFCLRWQGDAGTLAALLARAGAVLVEGPVQRIGARDQGHAAGLSSYVRDPDGNLLEFIIYPDHNDD